MTRRSLFIIEQVTTTDHNFIARKPFPDHLQNYSSCSERLLCNSYIFRSIDCHNYEKCRRTAQPEEKLTKHNGNATREVCFQSVDQGRKKLQMEVQFHKINSGPIDVVDSRSSQFHYSFKQC